MTPCAWSNMQFAPVLCSRCFMHSNVLSTVKHASAERTVSDISSHCWQELKGVCRKVETPTLRVCESYMALSTPLLARIMLAAMRTTSGLTPNCNTALDSRNMSASLCTPSSDSVSESCSSSLSLNGIVSPGWQLYLNASNEYQTNRNQDMQLLWTAVQCHEWIVVKSNLSEHSQTHT